MPMDWRMERRSLERRGQNSTVLFLSTVIFFLESFQSVFCQLLWCKISYLGSIFFVPTLLLAFPPAALARHHKLDCKGGRFDRLDYTQKCRKVKK